MQLALNQFKKGQYLLTQPAGYDLPALKNMVADNEWLCFRGRIRGFIYHSILCRYSTIGSAIVLYSIGCGFDSLYLLQTLIAPPPTSKKF